jgi:hypothetical protein
MAQGYTCQITIPCAEQETGTTAAVLQGLREFKGIDLSGHDVHVRALTKYEHIYLYAYNDVLSHYTELK